MIAFHVRKEVEHGKIVNRKRIRTRHIAEKRRSVSGEVYKPLWQTSDYLRTDFEPVTPHTLRHTFATRCIERGMNPKTLQIILGHSTIQLTMNLYCHVTDDMLISEMSKFENGANENPEGVIPINGVKVV